MIIKFRNRQGFPKKVLYFNCLPFSFFYFMNFWRENYNYAKNFKFYFTCKNHHNLSLEEKINLNSLGISHLFKNSKRKDDHECFVLMNIFLCYILNSVFFLILLINFINNLRICFVQEGIKLSIEWEIGNKIIALTMIYVYLY